MSAELRRRDLLDRRLLPVGSQPIKKLLDFSRQRVEVPGDAVAPANDARYDAILIVESVSGFANLLTIVSARSNAIAATTFSWIGGELLAQTTLALLFHASRSGSRSDICLSLSPEQEDLAMSDFVRTILQSSFASPAYNPTLMKLTTLLPLARSRMLPCRTSVPPCLERHNLIRHSPGWHCRYIR